MNPYELAWKRRLEPVWDELLLTAGCAEDGAEVVAKAESARAFLDGALSVPTGQPITLEAAAEQLKALLLEVMDAYDRDIDYMTGAPQVAEGFRHRYEILEAKTEAAGLLLGGGEA